MCTCCCILGEYHGRFLGGDCWDIKHICSFARYCQDSHPKVAVVFTSTNSSNVHVLPSLMGKKWHVGFNLLEFLTSSFKNLPIFIFLVSICWLLPLLLAPHPQRLQSQDCATYNNVTQSRSPNTGGKAGCLSLLLLLKGVR